MKRITILLIFGLNFLTWGWAAEKPATVGKSEWPSWRGDGSGSSRSGTEMVASLNDAKLVWQSEEIGHSPLYAHPGTGYCDPVIAGGRVFVFWFRRSGSDLVDMHWIPHHRWYSLIDPPDNPEAYAIRIGARSVLPSKEMSAWQRHVRADDVITCFDERTGKKLWEKDFPERGANLASNFGPLCVPCVRDGRVYALGSSGQVYALDAVTGRTIWQNDLGKRAEQYAQTVEIFASSRHRSHDFGNVLNTALLYADGVVVVGEGATFVKEDPQGHGLVGFDAATGQRLWSVPSCLNVIAGVPAVWRHDGREYILAVGERMMLIEPKTGKVLWSIGGPNEPITAGIAPAVSGDYVVVNKNYGKVQLGNSGPNALGPACYQVSLTGAKRLWGLPIKECDDIGNSAPVADSQYAYVPMKGASIVCVELSTGKKMGEPLPGFAHAFGSISLGDNLIGCLHNGKVRIAQAFPIMKPLPGVLPGKPDVGEYHTPAFASGRMYWRGNKTLWAYDLRKNPAPLPEPVMTPSFTGKDWDEMEPMPVLVKMLESRDEISVRRAIHQLGQLGPKAAEATPVLVKVLEAGDPAHAALAARALSRIGSGASAAVPVLLKYATATDANLSCQATKALCHIRPQGTEALEATVDAVLAQPWFYTIPGGPGPGRMKSYRTVALSLLGKEALPILLARSRSILEEGLKAQRQVSHKYQHITDMASAAYVIEPKSAAEFLAILEKIPLHNPPVMDHSMLHWTKLDLNGNMDLREGKGVKSSGENKPATSAK